MNKKKNTVTEQQLEGLRQQYEAEIERLKATTNAGREANGFLRKLQIDRAYNDLLEAMTLYKVNESKSYKEEGLTWVQFCEAIGIDDRTAERIINDIKPIYLNFSAKMTDFFGLEFNKIRLLGRSISANLTDFKIKDGMIHEAGDVYPMNPDGIAALIEAVYERHKKLIEGQAVKHEKQLKKKEEELASKDRAFQLVSRQMEVYQEIIPNIQEDTKARQRVQVIKALYEQVVLAIKGVNLRGMALEDPYAVTELTGLVKTVYADLVHIAGMIEEFEGGG